MFRFFVSPCQFLTRLHFLTTVFFFSQQPKQKKKSFAGGELDLAVLPSFAQSKRKNEDWFRRGDGVCVWVCLRFACVSMCVGWLWFCLGGVVSVCRLCLLPLGHGLCVCVFVSSALSLSVLSHCLALADPLTCFDLHLNLITFTRKYYLYYVCFASFNL